MGEVKTKTFSYTIRGTMTTHLVHPKHDNMWGAFKGMLFGFSSVCGNKQKDDGLWDRSKANCKECLKTDVGKSPFKPTREHLLNELDKWQKLGTVDEITEALNAAKNKLLELQNRVTVLEQGGKTCSLQS